MLIYIAAYSKSHTPEVLSVPVRLEEGEWYNKFLIVQVNGHPLRDTYPEAWLTEDEWHPLAIPRYDSLEIKLCKTEKRAWGELVRKVLIEQEEFQKQADRLTRWLEGKDV